MITLQNKGRNISQKNKFKLKLLIIQWPVIISPKL